MATLESINGPAHEIEDNFPQVSETIGNASITENIGRESLVTNESPGQEGSKKQSNIAPITSPVVTNMNPNLLQLPPITQQGNDSQIFRVKRQTLAMIQCINSQTIQTHEATIDQGSPGPAIHSAFSSFTSSKEPSQPQHTERSDQQENSDPTTQDPVKPFSVDPFKIHGEVVDSNNTYEAQGTKKWQNDLEEENRLNWDEEIEREFSKPTISNKLSKTSMLRALDSFQKKRQREVNEANPDCASWVPAKKQKHSHNSNDDLQQKGNAMADSSSNICDPLPSIIEYSQVQLNEALEWYKRMTINKDKLDDRTIAGGLLVMQQKISDAVGVLNLGYSDLGEKASLWLDEE